MLTYTPTPSVRSAPRLFTWLASLYMAAEAPPLAQDDAEFERRIIDAAQRDPSQFAPLYERYFAGIYRYCLRRTASREDAEDLASLVFSRALAALGTFHGGSVRAWLFSIAHNASVNYLRDRHSTVSVDEPAGEAAWSLQDPSEDALGLLISAEERRKIGDLVRQLPAEQRELLALRIAGGLSARDIGAVLGKHESAVRVSLHRIIRSLQAAYTADDERSGDTEVTR